jgi:hypothetical protein
MAHKRIKRITSHAGHHRFLALVDDIIWTETQGIGGWIPRDRDIKTPYCSGPTHCVYLFGDRKVFIAETAHKVYDVFDCTNDQIFATDEAATEAFLKTNR